MLRTKIKQEREIGNGGGATAVFKIVVRESLL